MNYSLAWLREPDMEHALPDLITGMIREIRLILLHPDLGNAAKLAAITHTVDLLAPPPGASLESSSSSGSYASNGTPAAVSVVALLARNARPTPRPGGSPRAPAPCPRRPGPSPARGCPGSRGAPAWCAVAAATTSRSSPRPGCGSATCQWPWPASGSPRSCASVPAAA